MLVLSENRVRLAHQQHLIRLARYLGLPVRGLSTQQIATLVLARMRQP